MDELPSEDGDSSQFERVDVVPRKVHQYAVLAVIAVGFVAGNGVGAISLIVAAACMALGRYWRPFDPFRVLTVSLLQPSGLLPKRMASKIAQLAALRKCWVVSYSPPPPY